MTAGCWACTRRATDYCPDCGTATCDIDVCRCDGVCEPCVRGEHDVCVMVVDPTGDERCACYENDPEAP